MTDLSAERLSQLLLCDFETGKLTWLPRIADMFESNGYHSQQQVCNRWNTYRSGKQAFTFKDKNGYLSGRIFSKGYLAHRVIWTLHCGGWPSDKIDHINGDPSDNRIANLREASDSQNNYNRGKALTNSTGYKGVYLHKPSGRWFSQIGVSKRVKYLGYFPTPELAHAAYCEAAIKFHGEFANSGEGN
jgi:HNH endonuclease/AP2 domain